jgi:lysophospholipase L1-like esterase
MKQAKPKTATPVLRTGLVGVVTENRINSLLDSRPGTTRCAVRWPITFGNSVSAVCASLDNFILLSGSTWQDNSNSFNVVELYIEIGSTMTPLTFNSGAAGVTVAAAANDLKGDTVALAASRTTEGWIKAIVDVPLAGNTLPCPGGRNTANFTGSQVLWYDPAATTMSAANAPGVFTWSGTAPQTRVNGWCPMILGIRTDTQPVFCNVGDSINEGVGDTPASAGRGGIGYVQRAAYNGNVNPISVINMARSGVNLVPYLSADLRWRAKMQYCDHMICELGTNHIGTGGTGTFAQLQTDLLSLWAVYKAAGIQRILRAELMPRATVSSDTWITLAGQTVNAGWQTGQQSQQINAWCATRIGQELHSMVTMEAVRDAAEPTKWIVNGTANYATADGTHPSPVTTALAAVNMRKCLESNLA